MRYVLILIAFFISANCAQAREVVIELKYLPPEMVEQVLAAQKKHIEIETEKQKQKDEEWAKKSTLNKIITYWVPAILIGVLVVLLTIAFLIN